MDEPLRSAIEHGLGRSIVHTARVHGGDVAVAFAVELDDGTRVFAKTHAAAPPNFFTTEATGLSWLRAADAIAIPEVLAVSDDAPNHLVLEWIEQGRPSPTTEPELGVALAQLHRAGAPTFGREDRRTTGSRGLPNEPCATWAAFYATNRLLPLARLARDAGALSEPTIAARQRPDVAVFGDRDTTAIDGQMVACDHDPARGHDVDHRFTQTGRHAHCGVREFGWHRVEVAAERDPTVRARAPFDCQRRRIWRRRRRPEPFTISMCCNRGPLVTGSRGSPETVSIEGAPPQMVEPYG